MDDVTPLISDSNCLVITSVDAEFSGSKHRPMPWLTVEPVVFLLFLAQTLSGTILTNLYLVHTCQVTFGFNQSDCAQLGSNTQSEHIHQMQSLIQPPAALLTMTKAILESCLPAFLSLFLGPWSDLYGRKPLLLWPLLGYCASYWMYVGASLLPWLPPNLLLLASLPIAFSGGFIAVISGVYSYISDVSSPNNRALRMALLDAALFGGLLVGTLTCSPLFAAAGRLGYVTVFSISGACCLLGFLYVFSFLPESVNSQNNNSICCVGTGLFRCHFVTDVARTCWKKRPNHGRAIIFMLIVALATAIMTMEGEGAISFMFTMKKFNWSIQDYTVFAAISLSIIIVGMVVGVTVLSKLLKIPDAPLALLSYLTKIAGALIAAISPASWFLYLASIVGVLGGMAGPLSRSILTKIVPREEIGKVFSLTASIEALTPLAASPLYTLVYNATLISLPGAHFLLSAGIFTLDFILLLIVVLIQLRSTTPNCGDVDDGNSDETGVLTS